MNCADVRIALGAYVLGGLAADEHQRVREHLAGCDRCREEYAGLAGLPNLLANVTPEQAELIDRDPAAVRPEPTDFGLHQLLGRVRAERDAERRGARRRGALLLAAVAAVVALAIGGGVWAGGQLAPTDSDFGASPTGETLTWEGENVAADVQVEARLTPYGWGTRVTMVMNGVRPGEICDFKVIDESGKVWGAGSWVIRPGHAKDAEWFGDVGVPIDQVARVELWEGRSDQRLVTWAL